jgi:hypothetical protein
MDPITQDQLDWKPGGNSGEDAWSLGEVFMHLAIDEIYLRDIIATPLLEGIVPPDGVTFLPPPPPYGTKKEIIVFWFERVRSRTVDLFDNWPEDDHPAVKFAGGLDAMNGLEWFEGYVSHEVFHHTQIRELIEAHASMK